MFKPLSQWTETDVQMHKQLDDLLSKNVKWEVNTQEAIQVYRCLVWYAQLAKKIKDSQAAVEKVTQVKKSEAEAEPAVENNKVGE